MTPWTAARQVSLFLIIFLSLFKFMSIESVMLSNHLILCLPLLLLPSIFPSIRGLFQWVSSSHQSPIVHSKLLPFHIVNPFSENEKFYSLYIQYLIFLIFLMRPTHICQLLLIHIFFNEVGEQENREGSLVFLMFYRTCSQLPFSYLIAMLVVILSFSSLILVSILSNFFSWLTTAAASDFDDNVWCMTVLFY